MERDVTWYQSELRTLLERYATREGLAENQILIFQVGERVERVTYFSIDRQGVALNATGNVAVYADWKTGDRYERIFKALGWGTFSSDEWEPPMVKSQLDPSQASAWETKPPVRKDDHLVKAFEDLLNGSMDKEQVKEVGEPMAPSARKKPGFFSGFFGGNQSPPEMNYDDLYLEDDTVGLAGAAVPTTPTLPSSPAAVNLTLPPPRRGQKLNTSNMTPEQLRARRTNIIEGSKFGRPAHESFMLFLLRFWLLVGPIAFVLLTTSEVAYILTSLTAPGDKSTLIITGGALFIDLAMMFTTFGVAIKRRDQAEKREANGGVLAKREEAEVWFGTALWLIFAAINIIGQSAFLLHIISASGARDMTILYIFVASRVVGFILGDASTAFFLAGVDNSHLKLIARGEREKASLYSDISKAEGERRLIEAKAEAEIILLEIKVQQERDDALFLADLKKQAFSAALGDRPQLSSPADSSGPNKSRLRRLDSN